MPVVDRKRATARRALPSFVGRSRELDELARVLSPRGPRVVLVSGPGGVGKSALCRAFLARARARATVLHVDARGIDPTPSALLAVLARELELPPQAGLLDRLRASRRTHVIVVDTYEAIGSLDGWLRDELVPSLPRSTRLVLSGREPPDLAWRVRAAGDHSVHLVALSNLPDDDARELLRDRGVTAEHDDAILAFTRGHPLALCLVAEAQARQPGSTFSPSSSPEVVRVLFHQLLRDVPTALHRAAIEASSVVRVTTESLLAQLLEIDDAHDLFEWLADRSFMETVPEGIFPHDLARELVTTELRWRDADRYAALLTRANAYYRQRIERSHGWTSTRDWLYAFHHHPVFRVVFALQKTVRLYSDDARPEDHPALLAMIEKHEGSASAAIASRWFATKHCTIRVVREGTTPIGMLAILSLTDEAPRELVDADPGASAILRTVELRPGEVATIYRWLIARDTYQDISPVQSVALVRAIHHDLTAPNQVIGTLVVADVEVWRAAAAHSGASQLENAAFDVGGRRYGVYVKDWRRVRASVLYFDHMLKLALGTEPEALEPEIVALGFERFADAVHAALRELDHPRALRENALLYSRQVARELAPSAPLEERVELVRRAVRDAVATLGSSRRSAKFHEALVATYLSGDTTQEAAAESLGLPFTTYRYRLARGIERVVDVLWHREVGH